MSETAALTDHDGHVVSIGAGDGNIYVQIINAHDLDLSIDEADEIIAGLKRAQLVAAEQRDAQASHDLALLALRGPQHYQPKHARDYDGAPLGGFVSDPGETSGPNG